VLDRCIRIVELRAEGQTLASAVATIERERVEALVLDVQNSSSVSETLAEKRVKLQDGREVDLLSVFHAVVLSEVRALEMERSSRDALAKQLRDSKVIDEALGYLGAGYNPVLLFDGERVRVVTDFVLAHELSDFMRAASGIVIPILRPLQRALSMIGRELPGEPSARPAPHVWAREGDVVVDCGIYLGGPLGFELIRESAKTVGRSVPTEAAGDE
jgi:hypothetical protein